MGSEYAPQAIMDLYDGIAAIYGSAEFSGCVGDSGHVYGYHRARAVLPADDYSVQVPEDRAGDAWAAAGLDVKMSDADMHTATSRLLASAQDMDDPRLNVMREFYGTVDSKHVAGWDTYYGHPATSDDSHLWHVHLSILRKYTNDTAAMDSILSVLAGEPVNDWAANGGSDMEWTDPLAGTPDYPGRTCKEAWTDIWYRAQHDLPTLVKEVSDMQKDLDYLKSQMAEILNRLKK